MVTKVGSGKFSYEVLVDWAKLPEGWSFNEVPDVAVDRHDRVYVFSRSEHPVTIFDREGKFLASWGEGVFKRPHGITLGPDDTLYCVDDGDHTVRKCTLEGKVLLTIGTPGQAAPFQGGQPFNRPTKVALDPRTGEIYVADGYGNARVHKYSPEGKLLFSWGEAGTDPGEFNLVHSIATDSRSYVYIADRENHRVQVFEPNGKYITQWNNLHRPCGLHIGVGSEEVAYIGELGPSLGVNIDYPNLGPRLSILNLKGERLARLGDLHWGERPDQLIAPHGIAIDSRGDLYLGEVSWSAVGSHLNPPKKMRSFRKLVRKG